uniref:Uncharacterized protein n=1 Tax=Mycena chlorophos TaxID=658473 RepID=A0ABQ0M3M4_MYCCL|nr:predicted protein [Mycena chlorophos]
MQPRHSHPKERRGNAAVEGFLLTRWAKAFALVSPQTLFHHKKTWTGGWTRFTACDRNCGKRTAWRLKSTPKVAEALAYTYIVAQAALLPVSDSRTAAPR